DLVGQLELLQLRIHLDPTGAEVHTVPGRRGRRLGSFGQRGRIIARGGLRARHRRGEQTRDTARDRKRRFTGGRRHWTLTAPRLGAVGSAPRATSRRRGPGSTGG